MTDAELIAKVLEGNEEAKTLFYNKFKSVVYAYVISCQRKGYPILYDDVDDIAQELFMYIYNTLNKFDESKSKIKTWVFMKCHDMLINIINRTTRIKRRVSNFKYTSEFDPRVHSKAVNNVDQIVLNCDRDVVQRALLKLKPNYRNSVYELLKSDFDFYEAGKAQGLGYKGATYRFECAVKQLREVLHDSPTL